MGQIGSCDTKTSRCVQLEEGGSMPLRPQGDRKTTTPRERLPEAETVRYLSTLQTLPPTIHPYLRGNPDALKIPGESDNKCLKHWYDHIGGLFVVYTQLSSPKDVWQSTISKLKLGNHLSGIDEAKPWMYQVLLDEAYETLEQLGQVCGHNHLDATYYWNTFGQFLRVQYGPRLLMCPSEYVATQLPRKWTGEDRNTSQNEKGEVVTNYHWHWDERGTAVQANGAIPAYTANAMNLHYQKQIFTQPISNANSYFEYCYGDGTGPLVINALSFVATFILSVTEGGYKHNPSMPYAEPRDPSKKQKRSKGGEERVQSTGNVGTIPWGAFLYYAQYQTMPGDAPKSLKSAKDKLNEMFGIKKTDEANSVRRPDTVSGERQRDSMVNEFSDRKGSMANGFSNRRGSMANASPDSMANGFSSRGSSMANASPSSMANGFSSRRGSMANASPSSMANGFSSRRGSVVNDFPILGDSMGNEFSDLRASKRSKRNNSSPRSPRDSSPTQPLTLRSPMLQGSLQAPKKFKRLQTFLDQTTTKQDAIVKRGVFIMILGLSESFKEGTGKSLLDLMFQNTSASLYQASNLKNGMNKIFKKLYESKKRMNG